MAHGAPVTFRELCSEVLSNRTRYLVLDLDGTVHLNRNLGELLGWELGAYKSYGAQTIERLESRRRNARWLLHWREPRQLAAYLARAAKAWAVPGTHYFFWSKLASLSPWVRRVGFRKFHADPIRAVQRGVQTTLMDEIASVPAELLPTLMERVWRRHQDDQVIGADDIGWIRASFPKIEIVLSSASPKPVVAFAAERLGVEHAHWSTPDRINTGEAKIEALKRAFGTFGEPGVEVVGMSDTAHGEDHCWARYFAKVVDINSPAPFPLIAPVSSPLAEVHSAIVLSRRELERRMLDPSYLDPRRDPVKNPRRRELKHADLLGVLDDLLQGFNAIVCGAEQFANPADLAYRLAVLSESSRTHVT
ncbi:MAG: hypothetical protein KJO40_17480 [Deltaproteobacteria bacterium]|nr:hypothetical protein [Deltaproteobacteria bacterium]MBT8482381.1 hypothetical protein [Deltaproteobacteria bacterium]NND29828.1 hypothetical protein [Myxococcales bacterium]NNL25244.1 hypothetical protein [Myxococcales bacterium]RZV51210.1 MAG: hypothetical protein EX268_15175 [Deltaproteobacteria bacterium]